VRGPWGLACVPKHARVDSGPMGLPSRHLVPVLAALGLVLAVAAPALAHADLASSDPEDKAVLATPPTVITLTFTEGLDQGKSSFKVSGQAGAVGTGKAAKDGSRVMTLDGLVLGPGVYAIKWTAASPDGHVVRGRLSFTVSEPTPPPVTTSPTPTQTPSAGTAEPSTAEPSTAAAQAPGTAEPTSAAPSAPIASADPGSDVDPAADAGSGTDVLVPIALGLVLLGGLGAFLMRRSRRAG
jgi:methionine-rich copper-binding protein CopC